MLGILKGVVDAMTKFNRGPAEVRLSGFRSLSVGQVEPPYLEMSRAGRLFVGSTTAIAGARAPVQDVPTTTANFLLFNPASHNRCLVPVSLGYYLGSGTAAAGSVFIAGVTPQKLPDSAALTANASNHGIASLRGAGSSRAYLGVGVTVPTMAASFAVVGGKDNGTQATVGAGAAFDVGGMFVVPPGYGLAIDVISGAGTNSKWDVSVVFAELELDLD